MCTSYVIHVSLTPMKVTQGKLRYEPPSMGLLDIFL